MSFEWEKFREHMINMYASDRLGRPCPDRGKHGEDYTNQCALRHSNAFIYAGGSINDEIADAIAPVSFFSYAGECVGAGANGARLARGAANWWVYLVRAGLISSTYKYKDVTAPASISHRNEVPMLMMNSNGRYRVSWLSEGEISPRPARSETIDLSALEQSSTEASTSRAQSLYAEYADLSRTWGEYFWGEEKLSNFKIVEGVWPRLIRIYLKGGLGKGRGFVYYQQGNPDQNHGFHVDAFDIPYYLAENHHNPWFGNDFSSHDDVTGIQIGLVS